MGMFDYVSVNESRFVCSEGHSLIDVEFQSKDFECVLGTVHIVGTVTYAAGCLGMSPNSDGPFTGRVDVYCGCPECPVFVQTGTGNLVDHRINFEVEIVKDAVRAIRRTSAPLAEFLASTPTKPWMAGCHGPMTLGEAKVLRSKIWAEKR